MTVLNQALSTVETRKLTLCVFVGHMLQISLDLRQAEICSRGAYENRLVVASGPAKTLSSDACPKKSAILHILPLCSNLTIA